MQVDYMESSNNVQILMFKFLAFIRHYNIFGMNTVIVQKTHTGTPSEKLIVTVT